MERAGVEWLSREWDLCRDTALFLKVAFVMRRADVHGNGPLVGGWPRGGGSHLHLT